MISDEGAAPTLADQQRARRRSALYFALRESLRVRTVADEAFVRVQASDDEQIAPLAATFGPARTARGPSAALVRAEDCVAAGLRDLDNGDILLERGEPNYPRRLAAVRDAPPFSFVRENVQLPELPAALEVGERAASKQRPPSALHENEYSRWLPEPRGDPHLGWRTLSSAILLALRAGSFGTAR